MNGANPILLVNAAWPVDEAPSAADTAAVAIAAGADGVGVPDSPRLFPDPLLATERLLSGTNVPLAGPCVLALGLRHPAVVASGLGTLAAAHPGRVVTVLARGESAVRNEGLHPPSATAYLDALDDVVRRLDGSGGSALLLLGAASGPRMLAGTASRLGGVLIDVGADPEVVASAVAVAQEAHSDARCWLFLRAEVTATDDEARTASSTLLGSCAHRLAAAPDWYRVPERLRAEVAELSAVHDYRTHGRDTTVANGPAASLVHERFFVTGTAGVVADRVRELIAAGADGLMLAGATSGLVPRLPATVAALRAGLTPAELAR
jgi:alkanesulfonate monooxygenase SsuD/methylene tetrahydromethanopterin reductase-like flavin-dependent oxidoreductase (luciferase family)